MWNRIQHIIHERQEIRKIYEKLDEDLWLERKWACYRIGQIESHRTLKQLLPKLFECLDDPSQEVKAQAVETLVDLPPDIFDQTSILTLLLYLVHPSGTVQLGVLRLLKRLKPNLFLNKSIRDIFRTLSPTLKSQVFRQLLEILITEYNDRAINAILAIGDLGLPESSAYILEYVERTAIKCNYRNRVSIKYSQNAPENVSEAYFYQTVNAAKHALEHYLLNIESLMKRLQNEQRPYMKRLWVELVRAQAVQGLLADFYPPFIAMLDDKNPDLVEIATEILGNTRDRRLLLPLILHIRPSDNHLTTIIFEALVKLDPDRFSGITLPQWLEVYRRLTAKEQDEIIPRLFSILLATGGPTPSQAYAEGVLANIPQPRFLSILLINLRTAPPIVKTSLIRIVKAWNLPNTTVPLLQELIYCDFAVETVILDALAGLDSDRFGSRSTSQVLKNLRPPEKRAIINEIFIQKPSLSDIITVSSAELDSFYFELTSKASETAPYIQPQRWQQYSERCLVLLAYIPYFRHIPFLLQLISHPNVHIRQSAIETMGNLQAGDTVRFLTALLEYPSYLIRDVQENIMDALGEIEYFDAIPALIKSFKDCTEEISRKIIATLKRFNPTWIEELLPEYAYSPVWKIRYGVGYIIGGLKLWHSAKLLLPLSDDPQPVVQHMAIHSLGEVQISRCFAQLVKLIASTQPEIRYAAILALGKYPEKQNFPYITTALSDPDLKIQQAAAIILGHMGNSTAVPYLAPIVLDEKSPVRASAITALARIGSDKAFKALFQVAILPRSPFQEQATLVVNTILQTHPAMALPIIHKYYRQKMVPIPQKFHLHQLIPSLTGDQLSALASVEIGDLISTWIGSGVRLGLQLLEAYGVEALPYIDRELEKENSDISESESERWNSLHELRDYLHEQAQIPTKDPNFSLIL